MLNMSIFFFLTIVHNLLQAQGEKIVDKVVKFHFRTLNIYCYKFLNEFVGEFSPTVYGKG